jgi:hypothetical protein
VLHKAPAHAAGGIIDERDQVAGRSALFQLAIGELSIITNSRKADRRGRQTCGCRTPRRPGRHSPAPLIHCRSVSRLTSAPWARPGWAQRGAMCTGGSPHLLHLKHVFNIGQNCVGRWL